MNKLFEQLLKHRRIDESFLNPAYENLLDPFLIKDMREAVDRIKMAVKTHEKVIIFGDYDVDGVTASVVMHDTLKLAGVESVQIILPDRFKDGYGMSKKIVQEAKEQGCGLVVTVDCGSGNKDIVAMLMESGVDVIVTDHHECPDELPKAVAVVNPKRKDNEREEFKNLAGVGVAFMVARALAQEGMIDEGQEKWMLDLVLLGTLCDNMKITGENRILTFFGTKVAEKTRRVGLKELIRVAGVKKINGETVGFQIGPRLNAAGRMESADVALELLMEENKAKAAQRAEKLNNLNEQRRKQQIEAVEWIKNGGEVLKNKVIVATGEWHEGILGIIAGRLCEDYVRPAFALVLLPDEGVYKGSGRSFGDFNLKEALDVCRDIIEAGGGHAGACGVRIKAEKIEEFRERINEYYESLHLENQERYLEKKVDVETEELGWFDMELMENVKRLEPFGEENEEPVYRLKKMLVKNKKLTGKKGEHLRLIVQGSDGKTLKMMAFFAGEKWMTVEEGDRVNINVTITVNGWNGVNRIEGRILKMDIIDK